ncbi:Two-component response regulator ARR17 [Acorus calamus]|uniref:Two-component response regulator ARR17 n=1 Tax=Acorus calamus TaxID=4465 RepID=A0AAV9F7L9_ACOCL|nr:Two-component response regulator ARR17 [Acorus calamus]
MGSSSAAGLSKEGDELHILAVDDNIVERLFVEKLLKGSAYKVTTADNGFRALEYLGLGDEPYVILKSNISKISLVITDYCMPGMTGYELMKKIKESPGLKDIPIVIMSSENIPTRIEKCLEEGAEEFMLKPLQQSDVKRLRCHETSRERFQENPIEIGHKPFFPMTNGASKTEQN